MYGTELSRLASELVVLDLDEILETSSFFFFCKLMRLAGFLDSSAASGLPLVFSGVLKSSLAALRFCSSSFLIFSSLSFYSYAAFFYCLRFFLFPFLLD